MDFPELRKFSMDLYGSKDPAHDFTHIERMIKICKAIAPPETNIKFVVQATYLHGSGLSKESIRTRVRKFLGSLGLEDSHIERIMQTVRNSSEKPQTIEERVLHDANILDALGAIGIARAFTKGGYEHQTLRETMEIMKKNMERQLYTPKAKETSEQRKHLMKTYLKNLEEEL